MTDDLVKRLRDLSYNQGHDLPDRVAARIEKLEAALREISHLDYRNAATNFAAYDAHKIACKALDAK